MPGKKSVEAALALIKNDKSKILGLTVGTHQVTPGQLIPKAEAQAVPELSFNVTGGTYLVICLDLDAPFPSFAFLSPILHWLQSGLKPTPAANGIAKLSSSGTPFVANYAGPGPPPPSAPHRYVFLLYEQPEDFDVSKYAPAGGENMGVRGRMRYDLGAFEKEIKLGPVIACNYFNSK